MLWDVSNHIHCICFSCCWAIFFLLRLIVCSARSNMITSWPTNEWAWQKYKASKCFYIRTFHVQKYEINYEVWKKLMKTFLAVYISFYGSWHCVAFLFFIVYQHYFQNSPILKGILQDQSSVQRKFGRYSRV